MTKGRKQDERMTRGRRQDDRMGKMKELPATASATHDWAHLTHAAAAERPKTSTTQYFTLSQKLPAFVDSCKCKSSIEVIFYGAAEVLQQDAIDLIYLATT